MYSSSRDQRDPWPPFAVSHPSHPSDIPESTYSPSHDAVSFTPLKDPTRRFVYESGGSPSTHHQSFLSQRHPASLSPHLSELNSRSVVARSGHYRHLLNATETCYQRLPRHHQSFQYGVTPVIPSPPSPSSASPLADRPSTADSVASWDICAKPSQEVTVTPTPTHGVYASIRVIG